MRITPELTSALATALTTAALALSGCNREPYSPKLSPDHPANPSAQTAPLPPPSTTLSQVATTAPSTAPTSAVYACPMHPEVTSSDPNARCPKCGMKLEPKRAGAGGER
jgi:hypothetical protein